MTDDDEEIEGLRGQLAVACFFGVSLAYSSSRPPGLGRTRALSCKLGFLRGDLASLSILLLL